MRGRESKLVKNEYEFLLDYAKNVQNNLKHSWRKEGEGTEMERGGEEQRAKLQG